MIKAFNKLTGIGIPETQCIVEKTHNLASIRPFAEFDNKATANYPSSTLRDSALESITKIRFK